MQDYMPSEVEYIPTGFKTIDEAIKGFERGNLCIFGARTGIGKSRFSMQIAENVSKNLPVLFFSLEMPARQLKYNLLSQVTGIFSDKIKSGNVNLAERERIDNAIKYCRTLQLEFVDSMNGIDDIIALVKSRCLIKDYGLIVIDYIQLIKGSSKENRHNEISEIAKKLKTLAMNQNVPIFCPAQLGRSVEIEKAKEPFNHHLKESGSLEEDADLIFFIWSKDDKKENKDVYFKCDKNRNNGRFVRCELIFDPVKISFVDPKDAVYQDPREVKNSYYYG
jgi:replicative DNA helicase